MTERREHGFSHPETSSTPEITDYEAYALELIQPSEAVRERLVPQLRDIVEQAHATAVGPTAEQAVRFTGGIVEWELFGKAGDPLPEGTVFTEWFEIPEIKYEEYRHFCYNCRNEAQERFTELGLGGVLDDVRGDIELRHELIKEALTAMVKESATYQLVQSFNSSLPPEFSEQLLSRQERQWREAAHYQSVVTEYGGESIQSWSPARRALWKLDQSLDDETSRKAAEGTKDTEALRRVRHYFWGRVKDEIKENEHVDTVYLHDFTPMGLDSGYIPIYYSTTADSSGEPESEDFENLVHGVAFTNAIDHHGAAKTLRNILEYYFTTNIMNEVLNSPAERSFDGHLNGAVDETAAYIMQEFSILNPGMYMESEFFQAFSRRPVGKFVEYGRISLESHVKSHSSMNIGAFRENEGKNHGNVLLRPEEDTASRLLLPQPVNEELATYFPNEELTIRLGESLLGEHADPYVPGYVLTSAYGDRYGFIRDPDGDPYARAAVSFTSEQRQQLADQYAAIGLTGLASELANNSAFTVADLADALMRLTIRPDVTEDETYQLDAIENFARFVQDETLTAQCTVSAKLLQLSLQSIFGKNATSLLGGTMLHATINDTRHMQVSFAHDGRKYILDSSAPSGEDPPPQETLSTHNGSSPAKPPRVTPMARTRNVPEKQEDASPLQLSPEEYQQRLRKISEALEEKLRVLFSVGSNEKLFKRVVGLAQHDPIRRTLEQTRRAARQGETVEALAESLRYVTAYKNAPDMVRRRIGLPAYETEVLDSLGATIKQIANLALKNPGASNISKD